VQGVVILFNENTVLLQKIYRWTGIKKVVEILSWIREMANLVIDEPEICRRDYFYMHTKKII
jgi:hypothetical protein